MHNVGVCVLKVGGGVVVGAMSYSLRKTINELAAQIIGISYD